MSASFPFEPDFQSLHHKRLADLWWAFWLPLGIVATALPSLIVYFETGFWWLTGLTTAISYVFLFAGFNHLGWKERTSIALDEQGLDRRIWAVSRKQQVDLGFSHLGEYFGFELLARPIGQNSESYEGHEVVVRNSKDTVAVANVIRIHDDAYWGLAKHDILELDGNQISLSSIFEYSDVRSRISVVQAARSDFICIGLTTNGVETAVAGASESLSKKRAQALGEALISFAGLDHRRSKFFGIGLGQSSELVSDAESFEARNQRAAVILGITRRQDIPEMLDLEHITEALVQNYRTGRLDLSSYQLASDIAHQLRSDEIDFAGFV
ncbi:MAG: hypothetical protein CMF03_01635 [Hyphomonas sp.]|nr:hypothetical protein [Hyphomonas sp.]